MPTMNADCAHLLQYFKVVSNATAYINSSGMIRHIS